MAFQEYPKRLYLDGRSVRALNAEEEAAVLAAASETPTPAAKHDGVPGEDTEKAAIRARLTELGARPPHHKAGLDKLRALLADAEALAEGAEDLDPEPAPSDEPDAQ